METALAAVWEGGLASGHMQPPMKWKKKNYLKVFKRLQVDLLPRSSSHQRH